MGIITALLIPHKCVSHVLIIKNWEKFEREHKRTSCIYQEFQIMLRFEIKIKVFFSISLL